MNGQHVGRADGKHVWKHVATNKLRRGRRPDETHAHSTGLLNRKLHKGAASAFDSRQEFEETGAWEWNLKQRLEVLRRHALEET